MCDYVTDASVKVNGKAYAKAIDAFRLSHGWSKKFMFENVLMVSDSTGSNTIKHDAIRRTTGERIKSVTGIDWRDYPQSNATYEPATKPAEANTTDDVLELIADCLTEITAELKDRNAHAFHFTANETLFITSILQDVEFYKWCMQNKTQIQRWRNDAK